MFEDLLRGWDGEEVAIRFDAPTSTWMFIGVHSTVLGPAMGGTRLKSYATPHDALADCLRLSGAMTVKQAAADLPYGGGKAVLAAPDVPPSGSGSRREMLLSYADLIASLGGTYVTAADMNTGETDMDVIAERCRYVLGRSRENGGAGDSALSTAAGVFHGIRSSVARAFGSPDLETRTVLVQGVGAVGGALAVLLSEAGAKVLLADIEPRRAADVAERSGGAVVLPDDVIGAACDVYAPCATGGVLSSATIPRLRCRVVAGAANNQLAADEDAELVRDMGILYAPDFVINAGGVLRLAGCETLGWSDDELDSRLASIGDTLTRVFDIAEARGITTDAAARGLALDRIRAVR